MPQNTEAFLNIGIIGVGHWGPNVARNIVQHPRTTLRWVCDRDEQALKRFQTALTGGYQCTTDSGELIDDPATNAIVITTPSATHYALAKAALESGKHVLCEKPLTLDVAEAETLCALAEAAGLKLMVGHTFLYNNSVLKIRELIENNQVGALYYLVSTRTHMGLVRNDVSVMWDLAPHDVAMMNFLTGALPERVSAVGARPLALKFPDVAFIHLFYPNELIGAIQVSWLDSHKERLLRVIGDKGQAIFNDLDTLEPVRLYQKSVNIGTRAATEFGEYTLLLRDGDIISPKVHTKEPLGQMINTFVEMVLNGAPSPSSGRAGLEVTRILCAAQESMDRGGTPVTIAWSTP